MKDQKYAVIEESELKTLVEKVNDALRDGWQPLGGIAFNSWMNWYIQAMVYEYD